MATFKATLKIDNEHSLQDLKVQLWESPSTAPLKSWSGQFTISNKQEDVLALWALQESRTPSVLIISDGRSGEINWKNISDLGPGATVTFQGTGPLK